MLTFIAGSICLQTVNLTLQKLRCSKIYFFAAFMTCLTQVKGGKKKEAEIKCALEACRYVEILA